MTQTDHKKLLKQLKGKKGKLEKYKKHNTPKERSCGKDLKKCNRCGRKGAHIASYGIELCRQCFREVAPKIGFKKYD